jgi:chromate transporter
MERSEQPRLQDEVSVGEPAAGTHGGQWPGDSIAKKDWVGAWATVAANSFGGPAGQIAVMHDEIVERRGWIGERRFLHALNYCMLLPGPEAQQLATYLGWLLRGPWGGLFAGALFILPGFVSIMLLSILFAAYGDLTWVSGLFFGISAAVMAIVISAVVRIGRRVIKNWAMLGVAVTSFVAIFVFELPFPLIVAVAIALGLVGGRLRPELFNLIQGHDESEATNEASALVGDTEVALARPSWGRSLRVLTTGLVLWFGPIAVLLLATGNGSVFVDVAWFFSTAAVLTFGGAYSVLAYISQEAVNTFGWLEPGEMISGLGMAETTPGPLIQVVQFVGFMGPYRDPGSLSPLQAGMSGAVIATWVTFIPSFLWIFLGAPFIEHLRGRPSLTAALSTVTAAVVGVVLNLAIWFALFTLFGVVEVHRRFGAVLYQPELSSLDVPALLIAIGAGIALFVFKVRALRVVAVAAVVGIAYQFLIS